MMSAFSMMESSSSSSSVEALAFNYLTYGLLVLVNNLWTLVALLTAALSFWRFNLLPSLARRHHLLKSSSSSVAESHPQQPTISCPTIDSDDQSTTVVTPLAMADSSSSGTVVKGNRVYSRICYDDDDVIFHHHDKAGEELVSIRRVLDEDQTLRLDFMKRLRLSDLGFYDYQDMRVLDGNVVKLWENNTSRSGRRCG